MPGAAISKADLFARLAEGHAAGVTVVTPNRRLAQVLKAEFDVFQVNNGKTVWEDADILPLASFAERRYDDALYADGGDRLPLLLSPSQERELWEEAIRGSKWQGVLLDVPRTAKSAMDAWRIAQSWRIAGALEKFEGNEDVRAFADWAKAYAKRCRKDGLTDSASLFDLSLEAKQPKLLVAYAFDIVPAQARDFFRRFEFSICNSEKKKSNSSKTSFASPSEELETAARWGRARLESGAKRIGVVIPELEQRRREVARVFARVMGAQAPFNLSLGEPLSGYPLVGFALSLLEFSFSEKPFEEVSRILRSPFLGGAEAGMAARALLDARLRRDAPAALSLPKLIGLLEGDLRTRFEEIFKLRIEKQSPHDWAEHFLAILKAAGFPGERALDSAEFQTRARFNEILGEFSRLSLVSAVFSSRKALTQLRRLCSEALFQPESADAPVQVLGLLESAGLEFDALWVSGLSDDAWPLPSRPNPFLPVGLQRMAGIPESSAEGSLELDRRITEGWRHAAEEVVFSWPRRTEDRDLSPSPLISSISEGVIDVPAFESWQEMIFKLRKTETLTDSKAPPVTSKTVRGGTRVLADQAACPFRAFARWRLGAERLESPEAGPDAMDRGILLHTLMAGIWKELGSSTALSRDLSATVRKAATTAVSELGLEGRFADLEVLRLIKLAKEWLALESGRAPFEVVLIEEKRKIHVGGLEFSGRVDRMDRLADGSHALIDYKTGARVTSKDWQGPRPDDPQLPLYAVTAGEKVSALAFAKLRAGDMKFSGFSEKKDQLPDVKQAKSWGGLVEGWKKELGALAGGFASGEAQVDPKYAKSLKTCANCDLQPLCRVHERLGALQQDEEGE
ncbi:MAG: PD-(D/E)XK nuclease family protein [Burkholderiales bacterium]